MYSPRGSRVDLVQHRRQSTTDQKARADASPPLPSSHYGLNASPILGMPDTPLRYGWKWSSARRIGVACLNIVAVVLLYYQFAHSTASRPPSLASLAAETLQSLLQRPNHRTLGVCAAIHDEGRFLGEWLIYHRLIGVDQFYLFDTNSSDNTLTVLGPWVDHGIVKLHKYAKPQGAAFQATMLRECPTMFADKVDWLLFHDADEFLVPSESLQDQHHLSSFSISEPPDRPIAALLDLPIYRNANGIVVSRQTFKNYGVRRLDEGHSLLATQILRDHRNDMDDSMFKYTKNLIHTGLDKSFQIRGSHDFASTQHTTVDTANVINVMGEKVGTVEDGTWVYKGQIAHRIYEPIVLYHYIERDLENCLDKLAQEKKVHPKDWRIKQGEQGCWKDTMYQDTLHGNPLSSTLSFYAGSIIDYSLANSWYGRNMPALLSELSKLEQRSEGATDPSIVWLEVEPVLWDERH